MSIKIIDNEPDIYLTKIEHERLWHEWETSQTMTAMPVDFETFVRQRKGVRYIWPRSVEPA